MSLFWYALVCALSSFAIVLKRELDALLLLSYGCLVTVYVLWLFITVPWVGRQFVIVVFPDHTHLLFFIQLQTFKHTLSYTLYIHVFYSGWQTHLTKLRRYAVFFKAES